MTEAVIVCTHLLRQRRLWYRIHRDNDGTINNIECIAHYPEHDFNNTDHWTVIHLDHLDPSMNVDAKRF